MPFVSTHIIKLPNIYWAFTATFILEMKEQRINRIQEHDQATWFQSKDSDPPDTRPIILMPDLDLSPINTASLFTSPFAVASPEPSYFLTAILLTRCVPSFNTAYSWKIDSFLFESNSWFCIKKTLSGNLPPSLWFCKCNSEKQPLYALSEPKHQERLKIIITYIYLLCWTSKSLADECSAKKTYPEALYFTFYRQAKWRVLRCPCHCQKNRKIFALTIFN